MEKLRIITVLVMCLISVNIHADQSSSHASDYEDGFFLISPLLGWNQNTLYRSNGTKQTADDWEYGLFSLYAHPRFVVNNMFFFTKANDADILGDFLFLNLYGDPKSTVTWNVGSGYLWHRISVNSPTSDIDIDVNVPMIKLGALVRCGSGITLNPYIGYSWESVHTDGTVSAGPRGIIPLDHTDETEAFLYGLTVKWHWRMMHLTAKYYLEDKQGLGKQYQTGRLRGTFMFNKKYGVVLRTEYMEHSTTDNLSVLMGPAIIF